MQQYLPKYAFLRDLLKERIQQGVYQVGDYLPSENELCSEYDITRTTVRRAMDELLSDAYIEKQQGKGSRVRERRRSLGLLNVKGFSEAAGGNVKTEYLTKTHFSKWSHALSFSISQKELKSHCLHFERLRFVGKQPVMLENDWFSSVYLPGIEEVIFVDNSFFKTLSQKYLIEIVGSDQEIRAISADKRLSKLLEVPIGTPLVKVVVVFHTSKPDFHIYSELCCNTEKYPIGNSYMIKQ